MDLYRSMGGPNVRSTIYLVWHGRELGTRTSGPPKDRYRFIFFFKLFWLKSPITFCSGHWPDIIIWMPRAPSLPHPPPHHPASHCTELKPHSKILEILEFWKKFGSLIKHQKWSLHKKFLCVGAFGEALFLVLHESTNFFIEIPKLPIIQESSLSSDTGRGWQTSGIPGQG